MRTDAKAKRQLTREAEQMYFGQQTGPKVHRARPRKHINLNRVKPFQRRR
jgi:hypothetical protein